MKTKNKNKEVTLEEVQVILKQISNSVYTTVGAYDGDLSSDWLLCDWKPYTIKN
jgi:hypothetical protein